MEHAQLQIQPHWPHPHATLPHHTPILGVHLHLNALFVQLLPQIPQTQLIQQTQPIIPQQPQVTS